VVKQSTGFTGEIETANRHGGRGPPGKIQAIEKMSEISTNGNSGEVSPILLVPYMWIGDFVRCHTVVRVLKERWPDRPVDVLTDTTCAPLLDYMPGVRKGIVWNLPRGQLALGKQLGLAAELRKESYGSALIMSRKWKAALAPTLAGIPERTGFIGEFRLGLLNDWRRGEKELPHGGPVRGAGASRGCGSSKRVAAAAARREH
jgi:hypothetical protein